MPVDPPLPRSHRKGTVPGIPKSLRSSEDLELHTLTELRAGAQIRQSKTFDIVERIGEGGMGKVYRAYDPIMDQYVALKVLKLDVPEDERKRFRREAVVAANFSHPNLPRVLDRGSMPKAGLEWMTMEYLRGRDLGLVIDLGRSMPFPLLVDMFSQTLDALEYIHTRRIIHCDVKPDNIFITRDPYDRRIVIIKLIDFGVCKSLDHSAPQKQIIGDPRYMAPEQTVLGGKLSPRTDLYALGLTMFEALVGEHAYGEDPDITAQEMLRQQNEQEPPPVATLLPQMPPKLAEAVDVVIAQACAKDPNKRYESAAAMKEALRGLLDIKG